MHDRIKVGYKVADQEISCISEQTVIVVDETVAALPYTHHLLKKASLVIQIPSGEEAKSRQVKSFIEDKMLARPYLRDTTLIAIGGGVTTDIAGFVASTYCRGIDYIACPTTLLGMVDASIGGKNGINTATAKNCLGTVYSPSKVVVDLAFLSTLPQKEWSNGLAEVIKHGILGGDEIFSLLSSVTLPELQGQVLQELVACAIAVKEKIVQRDPNEGGLRKVLNLGHTIAHGIEVASHYSISHGQAVAWGLEIEGKILVAEGALSQESYTVMQRLLRQFHCQPAPQHLPPWEEVWHAIATDKKCRQGEPMISLPSCMRGEYVLPISPQTGEEAWQAAECGLLQRL